VASSFFLETDGMKRILLIPVLSLAALLSVGCNYDGNTIRAEVPGGNHGQSGMVPTSGNYTLFHVTEFDKWGAPTKTVKVATLNLKENERVGFRYVVPEDKQYDADARSQVVAYAGSHEWALGPIQGFDDHYYWANPDEWDGYWSMRPVKVLGNKATMY
jgi:hypothetical protein